jgi:hypothetical protein
MTAASHGVELAADPAAVEEGVVELAEVERVADVVVERLELLAPRVLAEVAVIHLHDVREVPPGRLGRHLGPVIIPADGLGFDRDVGMLLVVEIDDGIGALVALGIASPESSDRGLGPCAAAERAERRGRERRARDAAGELPARQSAHLPCLPSICDLRPHRKNAVRASFDPGPTPAVGAR